MLYHESKFLLTVILLVASSKVYVSSAELIYGRSHLEQRVITNEPNLLPEDLTFRVFDNGLTEFDFRLTNNSYYKCYDVELDIHFTDGRGSLLNFPDANVKLANFSINPRSQVSKYLEHRISFADAPAIKGVEFKVISDSGRTATQPQYQAIGCIVENPKYTCCAVVTLIIISIIISITAKNRR